MLMSRLNYSPSHDTLIHVGDLVAKGSRHSDVLDWFQEHNVLGVRGNHDQPVIQWRAWMEWTGGYSWEEAMDELNNEELSEVEMRVGKMGRKWPKGWEWKGEHWHIAR
jgi:predicted phosphodiesterase